MGLYRGYNEYLKERYGTKVYKVPVALPVTCPNRDGRLSSEGCIFCGSIKADYEGAAPGITAQLNARISHMAPKYKAEKFIAYFINFTNTYVAPDLFRSWVEEACSHPSVVGLDVSTRPDCIHEVYLDILSEARERYGTDITVELGLQTANPHTLLRIGRCHTAAEFVDAALRIGRYGFELCAHLIADLPWDDRLDVEETAKLISVLPVTQVKIHSLYVLQGTPLAAMYERGECTLLPLEEYVERVVLILSKIRPDMVVQRMVGRASANALAIHEGKPWWDVKKEIERVMVERHITAGCACDYMDGSAVRHFVEKG